MKKFTLLTLTVILLFAGCKKTNSPQSEAADEPQAITKRSCATNEVLQAQLAADPSLRARMEAIEAFTQKAIASGQVSRLVNGVIEIPVVVNVLYNTTAQNISAAQIQSQIDVLNEDYNNTNADKVKVPAEFQPVDGSVGIRFVLASTIRKKTNKKSWSSNDDMKRSSRGGIDPTDPAHNLNMWACALGQGLLGYAQFPGGAAATDGVVILYSAFGSRTKAPSGTYTTAYDKGRTATHEVGHWLNLRHIWGDANCGNDLVADTPPAATSNYGCPNYPKLSTCTGGKAEMTMDYMDYTDDACMYMFTNGQKDRILAVFAAGGPRAPIGQ